jgi:hypothetical protein
MSQGLILIDALFCLLGEERKKKKKEKWPGAFFPGLELDTPCCLLCGIFIIVRCN